MAVYLQHTNKPSFIEPANEQRQLLRELDQVLDPAR